MSLEATIMKVGLKTIRDYCKDLYWTIIEYDDADRLKPILRQYAEKPCYDGIVLDILEDIMHKQMMHEKSSLSCCQLLEFNNNSRKT